MPALSVLLSALSAAPPAPSDGQILSTHRNGPHAAALGGTPVGTTEGDGTFGRSLGCGLLGSVAGGFLGYWSLRGLHSSTDPGTGALVGTASGMVLGSALGAWSKREAGASYSNPLPPVLGAAIGGSLGVGVWGLAGLLHDKNSTMSWEEVVLLIGAPWIGSAIGAGIEQGMERNSSVGVAPWIPETGGAGLQASLRY